jgi:hypothetical protein
MKFSLENLFDFKQLLRHLSAGLTKLSLNDNFEGFETTLHIISGDTLKVRNSLKFIPSTYIVKFQKGHGIVTAGDDKWTSDFLYLKNWGPNDVIITVQFLR